VPGWDFAAVKASAEKSWNAELGKIEVAGGTAGQFRTFYTALYHAMLTPNVFSDADHRYRGMDGTIRTAKDFTMYTVFSLWDTFRAEHPLLTILDEKRTTDFIRSLVAKSEESTVLPVWELSANETWCMIGYQRDARPLRARGLPRAWIHPGRTGIGIGLQDARVFVR
jgi:putative alpha-1,2-mannosidase